MAHESHGVRGCSALMTYGMTCSGRGAGSSTRSSAGGLRDHRCHEVLAVAAQLRERLGEGIDASGHRLGGLRRLRDLLLAQRASGLLEPRQMADGGDVRALVDRLGRRRLAEDLGEPGLGLLAGELGQVDGGLLQLELRRQAVPLRGDLGDPRLERVDARAELLRGVLGPACAALHDRGDLLAALRAALGDDRALDDGGAGRRRSRLRGAQDGGGDAAAPRGRLVLAVEPPRRRQRQLDVLGRSVARLVGEPSRDDRRGVERQRELGVAEAEREPLLEVVDEIRRHRERRAEGRRVVLRRGVERDERVAARAVIDEEHGRRTAGDPAPDALDDDEPGAVRPSGSRRADVLDEWHVVHLGIEHGRNASGSIGRVHRDAP